MYNEYKWTFAHQKEYTVTYRYEQKSLEARRRIVAEIDPKIFKLAKSLAALQGRKLNEVIETLLREWISGSAKVGGK
jgi:hypothetical protein